MNKVNYTDDVTVIHAQNLNEIQDEIISMQYRKGDTLTIPQYIMWYGHITASSKEMQLMLPLPKPIASDVTNITISANFVARTHKGYVNNYTGASHPITDFGTVTCQRCETGLRITIASPTAFTNVENNTLCIGMTYGGTVITFN